MRDDQEFNIKFVALVEAYPCLYDNTREDYHMSHVQERAWAKIAEDIGEGATITECKNRWKNLRGSYTKHLKKYIPSGSGASVKRPYYLSEYICFVLPFTKSRQAKGNVEAPQNTQTSEDIFTEGIETGELATEELSTTENGNYNKNNQMPQNVSDGEQSNIDEEVNQDVSSEVLNVSTQQDIMEKKHSLNSKQEKQKRTLPKSSVVSENKPKKKLKENADPVTLEDVNKSAFEYFEKKKQAPYRPPASANDDADSQFLLSLLPDVKKMTDKQKRKFKMGVLNLADQILDEPVSHTSVPFLSPTSDSYSSVVAHSIPSRSSTANSNYIISPRTEIADSQPTYQDISFSTGHSHPSQDTSLLSNIEYTFENID